MEVSNADRVVFPEDGVTKGDVVAYYATVAPRLYPFLEGRALTVERFPKGLGEGGFMQKNAPPHFGDDLIERWEVPKEDGGSTVYPVIRSPLAIPAYANLGVITFHVPSGRVDGGWRPDWLIWDLDPPEGETGLVREAAHHMRDVLGAFGVEAVLMTSGSKGYHLRTRVQEGPGYESLAGVARGIAALAVAAHPDLLTLAFRKAERGDRVFVDWLRNAPLSTAVAPWSLRAREGAPVATPIAWEDLDRVDPDGIRMDSVDGRLDDDVWAGHVPLDTSGTAELVDLALEDAGITLEPFDRFRS